MLPCCCWRSQWTWAAQQHKGKDLYPGVFFKCTFGRKRTGKYAVDNLLPQLFMYTITNCWKLKVRNVDMFFLPILRDPQLLWLKYQEMLTSFYFCWNCPDRRLENWTEGEQTLFCPNYKTTGYANRLSMYIDSHRTPCRRTIELLRSSSLFQKMFLECEDIKKKNGFS